MNRTPIVWLGRIGKDAVTVAGWREVTRAEATHLHLAWRRAKVKHGVRVKVGDLLVRSCRSLH